MSVKLTSFPTELKLEIAELLRAPSRHSSDSGVMIHHTVAEDIDSMFDGVADIRNFTWTCTDIREACSRVLFKYLSLSGEERCQSFIKSLDDDALSDTLNNATGVR